MQRPSIERVRPYLYLRRLYDRLIRPHLPEKIGVYNGIAVRDRGLFDVTDERPEYEDAIVESLRHEVRTGDTVVVVGGGKGVSAAVAANHVGESGHVTVYEGGVEEIEQIRETFRLNRVKRRTTLRHAVVGDAIDVYSDTGGTDVISSSDLPECDILELDCEGAEIEILSDLECRPRTIVVETHGHLDAPEEAVRRELDRLDYEVVDRGVELAEDGIFVLTAHDR